MRPAAAKGIEKVSPSFFQGQPTVARIANFMREI
jgi:hypothetical protein